MSQSQTVVVTQLADRHATLHERDFAQSTSFVVKSDDLGAVLTQAGRCVQMPAGRYSISISEPWDDE